jgi:hypothetical protein
LEWQLYWAAEKEWRESFSLVSQLVNLYNDVEIRGVASTISGFLGSCPTSCAADKKIQIDSESSARMPQGRMMHEAGHIANAVLQPRQNGDNYCWQETSSCGWSINGAEYGSALFEEGFATFSSDNTLWLPDSQVPTTCITEAPCAVNQDTRLEDSNFAHSTNFCTLASSTPNNPENRRPISLVRLLWDVYDSNNDADGDTMAQGFNNFPSMYVNLQNYAAGTSDNQIDEPWNSTRTSVTEPDGHSALDYATIYSNNYVNILTLNLSNCSPI